MRAREGRAVEGRGKSISQRSSLSFSSLEANEGLRVLLLLLLLFRGGLCCRSCRRDGD